MQFPLQQLFSYLGWFGPKRRRFRILKVALIKQRIGFQMWFHLFPFWCKTKAFTTAQRPVLQKVVKCRTCTMWWSNTEGWEVGDSSFNQMLCCLPRNTFKITEELNWNVALQLPCNITTITTSMHSFKYCPSLGCTLQTSVLGGYNNSLEEYQVHAFWSFTEEFKARTCGVLFSPSSSK